MKMIALNIKGDPKDAELWAKAVAEAKAATLAESSHLSPSRLAELEATIDAMIAKMDKEGPEKMSLSSLAVAIGDAAKMVEKMPEIVLQIAKRQDGAPHRVFMLGTVAADLASGMAQLLEAQKRMEHLAGECECQHEEAPKPVGAA